MQFKTIVTLNFIRCIHLLVFATAIDLYLTDMINLIQINSIFHLNKYCNSLCIFKHVLENGQIFKPIGDILRLHKKNLYQ